MNEQTNRSNRGVLLRFIEATFMAGLLPLLVLMFGLQTSQAGNASWKPHPTNSDWNSAANWRPRTIPNGPNDAATFGLSDTTDVSLPITQIEVDSVVFNSGASAFTFTGNYPGGLVFSGAGIVNNSGVSQTFLSDAYYPEGLVFRNQATAGSQDVLSIKPPASNQIAFYDQASAGSAMLLIPGNVEFRDATTRLNFFQSATADHSTIITTGGSGDHAEGAATIFWDNSTAGSATITITAATDNYAYWGGILDFLDSSTAGDSVITNEGSSLAADGGVTAFQDDATAANATVIAEGASSPDGVPGVVEFLENSSAQNATLIANGGSNGGSGGTIQFWDTSDGGTARIELFGNGTLDISGLTNFVAMSIGSLEGDGIVSLGTNTLYLTIGTNDLSTVFSGVIQGSGIVTKDGSGTLTLSRAKAYSGGTRVVAGFLKIDNRTGSATGSGPVTIFSGGTLGGSGIVGGSTLIYGSLAPGTGTTTLTIKSHLEFGVGGNYTLRVRTAPARADKVVAGLGTEDGVIISTEKTTFRGLAIGNTAMRPGTTFIAIDNMSSNPISGTFANLLDGGTITIGHNTFQANYEGGDGNDLTLTVVQ